MMQTEYGVSILADSMQYMQTIEDNSIDCIMTDPPYGILGKDNLIETNIDTDVFFKYAYRILKDDTFIAFFGQYPTLPRWTRSAEDAGFKYVDHIAWIKRIPSGGIQPLSRAHESFMIYKKGKPSYIKTKGKYEDVKVPGVMFDTVTLEGISRYIDSLWRKKQGISTEIRRGSEKTNWHSIINSCPSSDRCPRECNYTNVWSFLSHNQQNRGSKNSKKLKGFGHPTIKPIQFLERAICLLSKPGDTILDPFSGTGTTAIACIKNERNYINIEIIQEFHELSLERIIDEIAIKNEQFDFKGYVTSTSELQEGGEVDSSPAIFTEN